MSRDSRIGLGLLLLAVMLWSGCSGSSSPTQGGGPPPKFHGSPYSVGTVVAATSTQPEAEEAIAIDPNNPQNLVAGIIDFSLRQAGEGTTKYAVSHNGGANWTEAFVPVSATFPTTSDGQQWDDNRDPSIAIDKLGNVIITGVYEQMPQAGVHSPSGVYACAGSLPNPTFTAASCRPVFTNTSANDPFGEDKAAVAADISNSGFSGNVYVVWIHFTGCTSSGCTSKFVNFSRSTDHGVSWSAPLSLSSGSTNVQWPQVTVGSDGTVYVSYELVVNNSNQAQHILAVSSDGGQSFAAAQTITPIYPQVTFVSGYRKNSGPNVVVSPVAGQEFIYDVYATQNGGGSDIVVTRSLQAKGAGGFTVPISINDSTRGQRIFPAMAVDNLGVAHFAWFDTRNGQNADSYDIYATYSKDLAATFAPNARVTSSLTAAGTFIGDYAAMAIEPASGVAHPVWTNGGSTNGTLQTTTLIAP